jgi:hypothetical protein
LKSENWKLENDAGERNCLIDLPLDPNAIAASENRRILSRSAGMDIVA